MVVLEKRENKHKGKEDKDTVETSSRIKNTPVFIAYFILALILITGLSGVVSVSAAAPSITDWSSTGGKPTNKDNPQDLMYLVQPGDEITFSITTSEPCNYNWSVNKVDQDINSNTFTFTVPSLNCSEDPSECIWEIHIKAYNDNGEAHHEWVISTLNESEAPDIFDYFTDKKVQGRTETDPWGRALPEWSSSFDVSRAFVKGSVGTNWETYIPSTIAHGTWKFGYKCGITFYPLYYNSGACFHWKEECGGAHHHCMIYNRARGEDFSIEYDCASPYGPVENDWFNVTIIRTQDGWYYMFLNDILDSYVYDPFEEPWQKIVLYGGSDLSCFDGLEVYENKYLFPEREGIVYGQYIAKEIASGHYLVPTYKNGIIVNGRNITLSDINSAINNTSLFTYDAETKTAVCYTNLYINTGSELVIQNETLKFHCDSDGELEFAPGYGATLRIENSTITTDNEYYFVWNFAGPTTHLGYPITLYYALPYNKRYGPMTLEWSYYGRFIVKDSVINNSGYLYIDSPYELNITNTQITNLHEIDIGDYTFCADDPTQIIRTALKGGKSFFIQTDDLNIKDLVLDNVTFTGAENPLNITFYVNAHRDKINIYNINLQNGNIIIENPIAQTTRQSHTCYVGGSSNVWGSVYLWKSYITSEVGLVNCKFNDIIITPVVHTDKAGRNVNKSALVKYYLDVKVVDANGEPVSDANVTVSCEQSWTEEDRKTNHYPVENIETAHPYATGKYRCVYHHYRVVEGLPLSSTLTGTDGHTPLPSDKANTLVITDYKKYLNTGTGEVKQENFTYSITASKDGKTASMNGLDIDESWYRENPDVPTKTVVCNIDTGNCWIEGVATGTLSGTVTNTTGAPIEGALIKASSHQTTTNSTGGYTITLPAGNYTLTASKTGYQSATSSATVNEGATTTVDFTLTPIPADTTSPSAVIDLSTSNPTPHSITLTWTAPGDDGNTGTASQYDIRYSTSEITEENWNSATQCTGEPAPKTAGSSETFTVTGLSPNTTYYFALKTADEVPNWSPISNSPSGKTTQVAGGLVGYWKFDEGAGTTAVDSSGNNNNGTLIDNPDWVNGKIGKALGFNGSTNYVEINDSDSLDGFDEITIEAWVKPILGQRGAVVSRYLYDYNIPIN
ncbi:PEGA domain-containing protein, partial [Methanophagales archaeon]